MENLNQNSEAYISAQKRLKKLQGFYSHLFVYVIINIVLIVISFNNRHLTFDNFFNLRTFATPFFWGIGLFFHAMGVFGSSLFFGKDWEERKIQEIMNKKK